MIKKCITSALILLSLWLLVCVCETGGAPASGLGVYWALVSVYWGCNLWSQL